MAPAAPLMPAAKQMYGSGDAFSPIAFSIPCTGNGEWLSRFV